ncbi:hypothetical protein F5Y14DRAFT_408732 [Nemania sp. NC0429]|nr:hypothetical protein F5Y14DRAFT_408732 [Nemania sp. NC0429]
MVSFKSIFLLGLVAISTASPTPTHELQARAKIPDNLNCDNTQWTSAQIKASIQQARNLESSGYAYPKTFGNKAGNGSPLFSAQGQLYEFPLTDPVWNNGKAPGTFRVIVKEDYGYVGVTNKDIGIGGTVHKC